MMEQQLAVGGIYRFTFKPEFVRHGVCPNGVECLHKGGGVFKVRQICTYVEILQARINLYANFFAPLGYSTDEYQKYYNGKPEDLYTPEYTALTIPVEYYKTKYAQERTVGKIHRLVETGKSIRTKQHLENISFGFNPIYKLVDVVNPDDIVYAPEKTILGVPEIGVREYQSMTLAVTVGYWDDPTKLDGLLLNVRERLAAYGIPPKNVEVFSSESVWMTPEEYDTEVDKQRRPGELVEITEKNISKYAGKSVIKDGEFCKLVDNLTEGKEDADLTPITAPDGTKINCVGAKSLSRQSVILDIIPFLDKIDTSDANSEAVFETNKKYYIRLVSGPVNSVHPRNSIESNENEDKIHYGDVFVELTEGKDYAAGDPMIRYVPFNSGEHDQRTTRYIDKGPDYVPIFSPVAAQAALAQGITLYTCTNKSDGYDWVDDGNGGKEFSRTSEYDPNVFEEFAGSEIPSDDKTLYFYKKRDHIWEETKETSGSTFVQSTEEFEYFVIDYSKAEGLKNLGQRFSYTTRFNTTVTLDLTPDNLVSLCSGIEVERIFVESPALRNKYAGRLYRYQVALGANADGKPIYEDRVIILPEDTGSYNVNPNNSSNYPGTIIGTSGVSWSRCFVTTDKMERSYIKKYHDELNENTRLQAKVDALEKIVLSYNGKNFGS